MANWDHKQPQLYQDIGSFNEYELVEGNYALPLAEAPPTDPAELAAWSPVAVVRAHAPYRIRRVHFRGKKNGSPPVVPSPESSGAFQFLTGSLFFRQPQLDNTLGNFNWETTGQYEFVESCRSAIADGFVLSSNPFSLSVQYDVQAALSYGPVVYGAVAQAGPEAKIGYTVAQQMTLADPFYTYCVPSFVPSLFFNGDLVNGYAETSEPFAGESPPPAPPPPLPPQP